MGTVEHDTARHYAELDAQERDAQAFAAWLTGDRYNEAVSALWAADKLTLPDLFALTVEAVCVGDLADAAALSEAREEAGEPRNLIAAQLLEDWERHKIITAEDHADGQAFDAACEREGGYL